MPTHIWKGTVSPPGSAPHLRPAEVDGYKDGPWCSAKLPEDQQAGWRALIGQEVWVYVCKLKANRKGRVHSVNPAGCLCVTVMGAEDLEDDDLSEEE